MKRFNVYLSVYIKNNYRDNFVHVRIVPLFDIVVHFGLDWLLLSDSI